jgi:hypothetical protein
MSLSQVEDFGNTKVLETFTTDIINLKNISEHTEFKNEIQFDNLYFS